MENTQNPHAELARWTKALAMAEVISGLPDPLGCVADGFPWGEVAVVAGVTPPGVGSKAKAIEIVQRTVGASPLAVMP